MYPRLDLWFFRDRDGMVKQYNIETITHISDALIAATKPTIQVKIGKHDYTINLLTKKQINTKTNTSRDVFRETDLATLRTWSVEWTPNDYPEQGASARLIQLDPNSKEYKNVETYFYLHMPCQVEQSNLGGLNKSWKPCNRISKIEKIINPKLREQWLFLLRKIREDNNQEDSTVPYTKLLWHGSGTLQPKFIYEDVHYGWKLNYSSQKNLWGPGLYFGEDAQYCHKYTYKTPGGQRQIFLAEVITGDDIISLEDNTIKEPWLKEDGKTRYDSVCGVRHEKSWIWIVYASGRAYPSYLVEYEE